MNENDDREEERTNRIMKYYPLIMMGMLVIAGIIIFALVLFIKDTSSDITQGVLYRYDSQGRKTDTGKYNIIRALDKSKSSTDKILLTEWEIFEVMHDMANTKITANEIWNKVEITPQRVESLIAIVEACRYPNRDKLLEILRRWQNKDFSKADQDHNYLWEYLGGNIGRATGIK